MENLSDLSARHPYGWHALHTCSPLREDEIIRATSHHQILVLNLIEWIDIWLCFGILEQWTRRYVLAKATPILEKEVPRDNCRLWKILSDPYKYFSERDGSIARKRALTEFRGSIDDPSSKKAVVGALLAHIELGCKNYKEAAWSVKIALCEEVASKNTEWEDFEALMQGDSCLAGKIFQNTEYEEALILCSFHNNGQWSIG